MNNEFVWDKFFNDNPGLRRGENMHCPVCMAYEGKIYHSSLGSGRHTHPPLADTILAKTRSILRADLELPYSMTIPNKTGWVYPLLYLDETYDPELHPETQLSVKFRFGIGS
jgi:hypothetical protein